MLCACRPVAGDPECQHGKDVTIAQLREQGYRGFYAAIGAQKSAAIRCPGETLTGVLGGVDFLRSVNLGEQPDVGKAVAVIGGGNVSIDIARAALRLGAEKVYLVYRRGESELKADREEIEDALAEGIELKLLRAPAEITGKDGKVDAIRLEVMELGEPDASGRRKPVGAGEYETMDVNTVIGAIGQRVDWGALLDGENVELRKNGTAVCDGLTLQTAQPDIFVVGDVATGPKFAIDAIAAGKEAAISLHRYVHEGQSLTIGRNRRSYPELTSAMLLCRRSASTLRRVRCPQHFRNTKRPGYFSRGACATSITAVIRKAVIAAWGIYYIAEIRHSVSRRT